LISCDAFEFGLENRLGMEQKLEGWKLTISKFIYFHQADEKRFFFLVYFILIWVKSKDNIYPNTKFQ